MLEPRPQTSAACPPAAQLEQYRLGTLSDELVGPLEQHVESCERCLNSLEAGEDHTDPLLGALASLPCSNEDEPAYQQALHRILRDHPRVVVPAEVVHELSATAAVGPGSAELLASAGEPGLATSAPPGPSLPATATAKWLPSGDAGAERRVPLAAGGGGAADALSWDLGGAPAAGSSASRSRSAQQDDAATGAHEPTATAAPDLTVSVPDDLFPDRLGVYHLQSCIGRGAHGAVFVARHEKLDRKVAIKILRSPPYDRDKAVQRFLAEMRAIGKLDHPNIVRATDADEAEGFHYLVMEYVPGIDVAKLLRHHGDIKIADACEIARQTALALSFANQHQLVHRDVKPSNLLVTWNGVVKMLDLGLVAIQQRDGKEVVEASLPHGTADYMSPEQWTQYDDVDIRADLYSLGCTLYRLLTGRTPFQTLGTNLAAKRNAHFEIRPTPVRQLRADVPPRLSDLVDKLLAKDPSERVQTPDELAQQLTTWSVGADLAALVQATGVEPPLDSELQLESARKQYESPPGSLTRRRWLQAGVATLPLLTWGVYRLWHGGNRVPAVATQLWRPLSLAGTSWLINVEEAATSEQFPAAESSIALTSSPPTNSSPTNSSPTDSSPTDSSSTASSPTGANGPPMSAAPAVANSASTAAVVAGVSSIRITSPRLAAWELGSPLRGLFSFRYRFSVLDPASCGGVLLRYHRVRDEKVDRHAFIGLEWENHRLRWQQYDVRYLPQTGTWNVEAKLLAECTQSAGGAEDSSSSTPEHQAADHTISLQCGQTGIPEVIWNGRPLYAADWQRTPTGDLLARTREERLTELYRGRLGFFIASGSIRFTQPELKYDT